MALAARASLGVDAQDAGRERQAKIDRARSQADVLADLEELLLNGAEPEVIARRVRSDEPALADLVSGATAHADQERLLALVGRAASELGLQRIDAGRGRYDRKIHMGTGGVKLRDGESVILVRPGYTMEIDGERVPLMKAIVEDTDE
jgi:hypothetical protein